jgi:hypothetical protein
VTSWPHADRTSLLFGPPGTGKTSRLVTLCGDLVAAGIEPHEIAICSHTRASTAELRDRVVRAHRVAPSDMTWSRTLHSAALRAIGGPPSGGVMAGAELRECALAHGYDLRRVGEDADLDDMTPDDQLYAVALLARQTMTSIDRLPGVSLHDRVHAQRLADRFAQWARARNMIDFVAMLERAVEDEASASGVRVALIDEAQDLSPLAVRAAATLFRWAEQMVVVGDDDQSLYSFAGARGEWLVALADRAAHVEVLEQSYRVPSRAHELAMQVIGDVRRRAPKVYRPTDDLGQVEIATDLDAALATIDSSVPTMVLGRTWRVLGPVARRLRDGGIPTCCPGRPHLGTWRRDHVDALRVAMAVGRGEPITARDLRVLLAHVASGRQSPLPHGVKARAESHRGYVDLDTWGLVPLRDAIRRRGPADAMTRLSARAREDLAIVARSGELAEPSVVIRSIHDAKGLEADHVVILSDWGRRPSESLADPTTADDERRAAYVAVTRARRRVTIVGTRHRAYPWPRLATERDR